MDILLLLLLINTIDNVNTKSRKYIPRPRVNPCDKFLLTELLLAVWMTRK